MIKVLEGLLGKISREPAAKKPTSIAKPKRLNNTGDFRAVEIVPSVTCCAAAMQASGRRYLLRKPPCLPLMGCTMPTTCSCRFRKNADRRDSDRRLLVQRKAIAGLSAWTTASAEVGGQRKSDRRQWGLQGSVANHRQIDKNAIDVQKPREMLPAH